MTALRSTSGLMRLATTAARLGALFGACALQGCMGGIKGPADPGVCWQMVHPTGQPLRFNKVSEHVPNLETCAAQLEALRIKFIQLGGSHLNIAGVYQGQFIFVRHEGVFTSTDLDGMTYLALVRTGDGRLAVPGAHQTAQ